MNEFLIDESTHALTKYDPSIKKGNADRLLIPHILRGKQVDSIAAGCFKDVDVKSLTIGDGIKKLESGAFESSHCYNVILPNGTDIDKSCFIDSGLREITLPNDLYCIKSDTFMRCKSLKKINGGVSVRNIGNRAFAYCKKIKKIQFDHIKSVGDSAFIGCKGLHTLTLGNEVQHLGKFIFYSCDNLKDVTLVGSFNELEFETFLGARGIKRLTLSTRAASLYIPPHCFDETSLEEITFLGDFEPVINEKSCLPKNILIKTAAGSPAMELSHYFPVEAF